MFDMFISAFSSACSMEALVANFIGVALGIVFGALPGLTAVMGVALLIPLTFGFPAVIAFSALLGMYCGAIYAGSITAILVGTPGTAAAAATMLEGPKFTARGESLKALEMTTIASFIGGIFSCLVLATVAPQLAHFALDFSAPEYFSLGIFGLTIVATLSEGALLKGCIAALLGMLISMIGMDPLSGNLRMTFDSPDLINGVSLVPALVGLYALSQVLVTIEDVFMGRKLSTAEISRKGISLPDLWANRAALIRGSLFGTFIGIVPATGSGTASFAAYSETKRHSKHPELFGKGTLEGIAATESADTAVELDARLGQSLLRTAADASANQSVYTVLHQEACQCAVTTAVGVNDFRMSDFTVRSFIKFELFGMAEMLKDLTVFIGNCNFHNGISFASFA